LTADINQHCIVAGPFLNQLKLDYQEIISCIAAGQEAKPRCEAFAAISKGCAAALLSTVNRLIVVMEKNEAEPIYRTYRPIELKAFSGLESCATYFKYQYGLNARKIGKSAKPTDGSDEKQKAEKLVKPVASKSSWLCADETETSLKLQTDVHKAGILFDVGLSVLLVRTLDREVPADNSAENGEPVIEPEHYEQEQLWRIDRIERDTQGNIHLILGKQGDKVTYAPIKAQASKPFPALLIADEATGQIRMQASNKLPINRGDLLAAYLLNKTATKLTAGQLVGATHLQQEITLN
jgi:hypothetical protein